MEINSRKLMNVGHYKTQEHMNIGGKVGQRLRVVRVGKEFELLPIIHMQGLHSQAFRKELSFTDCCCNFTSNMSEKISHMDFCISYCSLHFHYRRQNP